MVSLSYLQLALLFACSGAPVYYSSLNPNENETAVTRMSNVVHAINMSQPLIFTMCGQFRALYGFLRTIKR